MSKQEYILEINNLNKVVTDQTGYNINLIENISFQLAKNQFKSILAPNNSGKTTLLRIIAGLDTPTGGKINLNNSSNSNKIAYIPSQPSSLPWLNVKKNIKLVIDSVFKGKDNSERIQNVIDLVGLSGYENHYSNNKSIGFRFRISLARAIAIEPNVIILDEPFNKLDPITKKEILVLLKGIHKKTEIAFLLGTSNINEAIILSDSIILLQKNPIRILKELMVDLSPSLDIESLSGSYKEKIKREIEQILIFD